MDPDDDAPTVRTHERGLARSPDSAGQVTGDAGHAHPFETKVDPGKLLICAIDLLGLQDKPEARQLLRSLLQCTTS
jgi:hypothetical protein